MFMKKSFLIVLLFVVVKVEAQTSTFTIADSLFEKGRYKLSLQELDKNEPTFLSNYKKAVIYESIDDFKKSAEFLEKAIVFKGDEKVTLKLAKTYQRLKVTNKAVKIYEEILAKDSLNLVLKYQLGKLYLNSKDADKAVRIFKYLIDNDALNANYSYQLALAYALKNERDRMINSFIDTYKKDTLHLKAIENLASSFKKLNDIDSTQLFVEKGLVIDKDDINLNRLKINQLFRDEKYKEAIPFLLNLDSIDKKDTYSMSMLGRTYYNLDSLEKAKEYFKKVSRVDREDFKARTYLGHVALKEKDYKAATVNYMMATYIGKEKRDEEYYGLATVYYEKKEPLLAMNNFEKAYAENSNNYKALFQLAKLTDDYYEDKKMGYKLYKKYMRYQYNKDEQMSNFVERRIKDIKNEYFMKGENLED
jgi:tetratricopeptide (TPR) repeat protein